MVFGLFSKERALKKAIAKASNKHAQSADRWAAMEKLQQIGTDDALLALCKRFSFRYDKTIEDQQEKQWTVDVLVSKGEAAYGAVRTYMKTANSLGYPLEILSKIASPEKILVVVDEIFAAEEPGYTRDPKKRIDLIEWLGAWDGISDDDIAKRICPYLKDFDENVRFKVTEVLAQKPAELAGPALAEAMTDDEEESLRLKLRMAEVLADNQLELGDFKDKVAELINTELTDYKLVKNRLTKKK